MGNGHPVAAVITRRDIAARARRRTTLFSTFGGNPVCAAAALAVLDVIEDERVLDRVRRTGEALRAGLRDVGRHGHDAIGDVRGIGLAIGVEIVRDRPRQASPIATRTSASAATACASSASSSARPARHGNVLKIRPAAGLHPAEVPIFLEALEGALTGR